MGLKKLKEYVKGSSAVTAGKDSITGMLADQWKEFFTCDALGPNVLVKRGTKTENGTNKGNDNVISNGSGIVVADGQCALVVDQGKVMDVIMTPGEYTYEQSSEPSVFADPEWKDLLEKTIRRFTYAGSAAKDQRVYYCNTKEIMDNKFGTSNPIPFRVVDTNIGLDLDTAVRCAGTYTLKMVNPVAFYTNVCGNTAGDYTFDMISNQLKNEFISALQPAFGKLSALGIRPSAIVAHTMELEDALNETLDARRGETRGLEVGTVAISTLTIPDEDAAAIKDKQLQATLKDPSMAAATIAGAQAEAMKAAANNASGAMNGFIGLGMAQQAGGVNAENLFAMGQNGQTAPQQANAPAAPAADAAPAAAAEGDWFCPQCGTKNNGNFCPKCGTPRPQF